MNIIYKGYHIFAFSDTHGRHSELKIPQETDILICAGDGVNGLALAELQDFFSWYASIPAKLRLFVAGNHELVFDLYPEEAKSIIPKDIVLLENSGICFDGIKFYSVAARPWLHQKIAIPPRTDFLITHGPAKGFLDNDTGCLLLRQAILNDKPHYHIFGHVHALGNQIYRRTCTTFCNISCLNDLEIELEK